MMKPPISEPERVTEEWLISQGFISDDDFLEEHPNCYCPGVFYHPASGVWLDDTCMGYYSVEEIGGRHSAIEVRFDAKTRRAVELAIALGMELKGVAQA